MSFKSLLQSKSLLGAFFTVFSCNYQERKFSNVVFQIFFQKFKKKNRDHVGLLEFYLMKIRRENTVFKN